jgi:ABC-2 type transport system permease protein
VRDALALYGRYVALSLRAQLQYRASFVMTSFGQFAITVIEFFGIWVLFARFGRIQTWSLAEVALFYGVVNVSFSFADALSRGFDQFSIFVKRGEFDRMLLRPRSTVLQVAGYDFALWRIGRLVQGAAVLGWAAAHLDVAWSAASVLLLAAAILGGTCLFMGLYVVQATLAFWTTETLELMNTLTYGGVEAAQYPLAIYAAWFRRFLTFVVPLACVAYFPVVAILERPDPLGSPYWFQCVAPLMGLVFLGGSLAFWEFGVRRYTSTGS